MGKETGLWDDSALITAFDQALRKYKVMHTNASHDDTTEGENSTNNENELSVTEVIHENLEPHDKMNNTAEVIIESSVPCSDNKATDEVSPTQESQPVVGTRFPESNPELTGATSTHGHMNSDEGAEYTRLLSEYYEIEEKRQKILQQLQQVSNWNDLSYTQCQTTQVHQAPNTSHLGHLSPCCPCLGHCCLCAISSSSCGSCCPWDAYKSLTQGHQVSAGGQCVMAGAGYSMPITSKPESMMQSVHVNSSATETAKTAGESVVSSLKFEASATSNVYEKENYKEREETSGVGGDQRSQNVDSETELAVVINAWYSAGFYTGRYLLEQSLKKGPH